MRKIVLAVATAGLSLWSGGASAVDKLPCPAGMICASKPDTILSLMKTLSPTAKAGLTKEGERKIDVTDQSYKYTIYFRDCAVEHTGCAALTFVVSFSADPVADMAFVNKWNSDKRPTRAIYNEDGSVDIQYDMSTYGGVSVDNFKDVKGWWDSALSDFADFYKTADEAKNGKPSDKPADKPKN